MNRVFILAVVALFSLTAYAGTVTLGTFSVNPQATFLNEGTTDSSVTYNPSGPVNVNDEALFLQLSNLACPGGSINCATPTPGTELQLIVTGTECFTMSGTTCMSAIGQVGAVFDSANSETTSSPSTPNFDRLGSTTIAPGAGGNQQLIGSNPNLNIYGTGVSTAIPNDFYVTSNTLVFVPVGANFLVLGLLDSLYNDDSGNVSVIVNEITPQLPATPEPATIGLLGAGLLGLAAFRRYRAR